MKSLLITGATGFVGSHLVDKALEKGFDVHITIRKNSDLSTLQGKSVQCHECSLFDKMAMLDILRNNQIEYIIHNAGITKTKNPQDYFAVNAHASKLMGEAAVECGHPIRKFVFISSLAALGPGKDHTVVLNNQMAENPESHYGKSKLLAEKQLSEMKALNYIFFRPTGVYGPRERDFFEMIKLLKKGWEIYIGKSPQNLSFIYIEDLAELVIYALESDVNRKKYLVSDGRIYDKMDFGNEAAQILSSRPRRICLPVGIGYTMAVASEFIHRFLKKPPLLNRDKLHEILAPSWACDTSELARDFKFAPQYDLRKGLEETIRWYQRVGWL
ncbi:MAG: NAD(P)-dependent oxidoreductase [Saprospiraceae bacterium]|nr:NAD(P)-dependent oxidoreductase [Saprospiraceae bacterium]